MASKLLPRVAFGLEIAGVLIGIVGSRSLHSKLVFGIGVLLLATGTLLLAAYFSIGNTPQKRLIGAIISVWTALFVVWLLVPALHQTPLLHYGTAIIWIFGLGVLAYILWRIDRQEGSKKRRRATRADQAAEP
jgi:divalent metal cation (Fe/Co/Zn/Cd) transporter